MPGKRDRAMHGAIERGILVRKPGKMRIPGLQFGNLISQVREFFVQFMGRVRHAILRAVSLGQRYGGWCLIH